MRNGNFKNGSMDTHTPTEFLPYLWGMETCQTQDSIAWFYVRSYRTYEEWKQSIADAIGVEVQCSYRTYEEWKHLSTG